MVDKEKLSGLAFVREATWNKRNRYHQNCVILNRLWKEIAEECGVLIAILIYSKKRVESFLNRCTDDGIHHTENAFYLEDYLALESSNTSSSSEEDI